MRHLVVKRREAGAMMLHSEDLNDFISIYEGSRFRASIDPILKDSHVPL